MARLPEHPDDVRMTLGEHLEELRKRVLWSVVAIVVAMVACLVFVRPLVRFLAQPVFDAVQTVEDRQAEEEGQPPARTRLVLLTPMEAFVTSMKAALVAALMISSPIVFYQLWLFVAAGLYPHERKVVHIFIPFSVVLFLAGTAFSYAIVLKYGLPLLLSFAGIAGDLATPSITLSSAINFVLMMSVVMGLVFQLPLVMMILSRVGLISPETYVKQWRYATVGIVVLAAILTPPDVFTQMAMAVPMFGLYWLGVLLAKSAAKKRRTAA
jgi:Tat protein translocase TatC